MTNGLSVDEPASFREALTALGASQKTSKGAPAYSRYINRRLGRVLAASAYTHNWSPNQVTVVSGVFTLSAIGFIALLEPTPFVSLMIVAMLVAGYALDAADGQLARLQSSGSSAGEWLDHTVDACKIATIHLAVLVNWYRYFDSGTELLWIPICFQAVATVQFFTVILTDQMRRVHRGTTSMILQGDGTSSMRYSLAVLPTDYGALCLALGLMFWPRSFVAVYLILLVANAGFLAMALPKWYREVRSFG